MMLNLLPGALIFLSESSELALLVKATLILIACLVLTRMTSRARASVRHLIVAASFAALVALPAIVASVPAIAIEMPAPTATEPPIHVLDVSPGEISKDAAIGTVPDRVMPRLSLAQWLRMAWAAGAAIFFLPVAIALWRLSMIRRTGLPVAWHRNELSRLADARGVSVPVELLEHEAVPGPMTFGISRPVIVLPPDAREWSEAELRRALTHELEHIQRGDWLMQIVARTVAALYWFHPLVWSAWRRLCLEAERSCDDAVVLSEERTDYAEQLVTLAQRMAATPAQPMLGMANRSDLSTRVTAVLDERLRRGRAGIALATGTIAAAAIVVLTVAPVRAVAKQADEREILKVKLAQLEAEAQAAQNLQGEDRVIVLRKLEQARADAERRLVEKIKERGEPRRKVRALDRALYEAANEGDLEQVKELVQAGANPSAKVDGDGSPLIGAARSRRIEITRYLLDQGADPNGTVEGDGSPLISAAQSGSLATVQVLVERGADVNLAVEGDENPLMNAAEGGHLDIVQYLVARGADIHTRIYTDRYDGTGEWRTALSQARKNRRTTVVQYLESLGARD
jgi:beta-lactamase regulating signal transducer with metallopeptidase domain